MQTALGTYSSLGPLRVVAFAVIGSQQLYFDIATQPALGALLLVRASSRGGPCRDRLAAAVLRHRHPWKLKRASISCSGAAHIAEARAANKQAMDLTQNSPPDTALDTLILASPP